MKDSSMQLLLATIKSNWPDKKDDTSLEIKPYFEVRDTLSQDNGIILKGQQIVIPTSMRGEMKRRLHAAHTGNDSMLRCARDCIFWPEMAKEIKQLVDNCETCHRFKPQNQKERLCQYESSERPWESWDGSIEIKGSN